MTKHGALSWSLDMRIHACARRSANKSSNMLKGPCFCVQRCIKRDGNREKGMHNVVGMQDKRLQMIMQAKTGTSCILKVCTFVAKGMGHTDWCA